MENENKDGDIVTGAIKRCNDRICSIYNQKYYRMLQRSEELMQL